MFHLKPAIFRVRKTTSPALGPHRLSDAPRPADHSARFSAPQTLAEGRGGRLSFPPGKFVRPRERSSFVTVCSVRNEVFVRLFGRGAQSDSASHPAPNGPVERKFVPIERNSFPNLTNLSNYEKPSPKTNKAIFFGLLRKSISDPSSRVVSMKLLVSAHKRRTVASNPAGEKVRPSIWRGGLWLP